MYKQFSISGGKIDSRNGHIINEDLLHIGKNYIILMDGATGLGNKELDDHLTSAEWYTKKLLIYLINQLENENELTTTTIKNIVKESILHIKSLIKKRQNKFNIKLEKYEVPSCSLIIFVNTGEKILLFSLGDCISIIKNTNSDDLEIIRCFKHNELDNNVLNKMKEISIKKNISVKEARNDNIIDNMLKINRSKMNVPNGYYIASIDDEAVNYATIKEYNKKDIEKVFICSDGFYFDTLNMSYIDFIKDVNNDNICNYIQKIKNELLIDKDWNKYSNRFKGLDDITAIVAYTNHN